MTRGAVRIADLLEISQDWARAAGDITMQHFGRSLERETKVDGTPVTIADRAAEAFLRTSIEARFPDHGILGEEFGETNTGAHVRWVLDPIDGTKTFVRGVPLYGVLIGIEIGREPMVGVAHFPGLGETVAAARGEGCFRDGTRVRVSDAPDLSLAAVLTTDTTAFRDAALASGWEELARRAELSRTWGDCYGHVLVATGRAEVMVDPVLSPWDAAPFLPILAEAGGRFTDLDGNPGAYGGSGVSTNGILHREVLEILSGRG
jgi:histidinol phosphatase-like enzyme (inositol monophosphatase family)